VAEKKRTTGKMPLSQVRLPGGEGEKERKEREKIFTRMIKSVMMMRQIKPTGTGVKFFQSGGQG
jgi:hypothetical protein